MLFRSKYEIKNKKILILGAGGVVPSIIEALTRMNVSSISISNRTQSNAEKLKNLYNNLIIVNWGEIPDFDMIINATSIGLNKNDKINLDFSNVGKNKFFYDVIYNPKQTNFLEMAKKSGNIVMNGNLMFIYQALTAFKIWHQINLEIDDETIDLLDS